MITRLVAVATLVAAAVSAGCCNDDKVAAQQPSPPSYSVAVYCAALGYVLQRQSNDPVSVDSVRYKAKALALSSAEQVGKGPNDVENDIQKLSMSKLGSLSGIALSAANDSREAVSASMASAFEGMASEFNQTCVPNF